MKPVFQTRGGAAFRRWRTDGTRETTIGGNCFQAAVASLFDLPTEAVPDLVNEAWPPREWFDEFQAWARLHLGVQPIYVSIRFHDDGWAWGAEPWRPRGWALAGGRSPRGHSHVVVVHDGVLAHDPSPEGGGLVVVDGYTLFLPIVERGT
jgi:hypothetical protein